MYLTRGGSVQRLLTSGPRGWPAGQTPWPIGPTLHPLVDHLHSDTLQEAATRDLKPKLSGCSAMWLGWSATTW
jgi:hypothetical protein